jgi:capsular exopolysaccharide synthesis family protein
MRQPRIYEATATIEYDPNPPRPLGNGVEDVAAPVSDFWTSREFFETQNRIIGSRMICERVVERLGLHRDRTFATDPESLPADWPGQSVQAAALLLQSRVTIEAVQGTRIVNIRVRDRNPDRAALLANTIAETFIEKTIEDRLGSTVSALEWLAEQLDNLRRQLDESELALHRFKEQHNILSVSLEDRQNLVANEIERFSQALTEARAQRIRLAARLERLRSLASGDLEEQAAALSDIPTIAPLHQALRTKLAERESLRTRYGPAHPRMQELESEIATLQRQLQTELNGVLRAAEADLREAAATEAGFRQAVEQAQAAGLELNLREIEYTRLRRAMENNSKLYSVVLERTTETDLTRMLRTTHVRIVDRALSPSTHISPRVTTNVAVGISIGLALGLGLALLLSRLDRRIQTTRDAEALGLTILGVIPSFDPEVDRLRGHVVARALKTRGKRQREREAGTSAGDLIVHTHPMSAVAENFRTVRTNLMFMGGDEPIRTLAVTSANPREGKTTVTTNLAIAIAQSGKNVLIVDTDLRRPRVHRVFGLGSRVGVSSIVAGEATLESAVQDTSIPNVHILACGPIPPNPSELLHRDRFARLVAEARTAYDFVIFDSPPLRAVTDAAVLAPQLDGTLVVVRPSHTTRDALSGALRQLRDVGAVVVGGVINGLDPRSGAPSDSAGAYYYGREGYYYSSYEEDDETAQSGEHDARASR